MVIRRWSFRHWQRFLARSARGTGWYRCARGSGWASPRSITTQGKNGCPSARPSPLAEGFASNPWLTLHGNPGALKYLHKASPTFKAKGLKLFTFEQFSAPDVTYHFSQPTLPALEEVMENFAELMQRLLEIQSSGRQRSPELIAEDERLMDGLQKRNLAGMPTQTVKPSQDGP